MPLDDRQRLAAQQASLVRALMMNTPAPPRFDGTRVRACAQSLLRKRHRALARAWPRLSASLAEKFHEHFEAYAEQFPLPVYGGPLADGRAFANWLNELRQLPDAGRLEALAVDMFFVQNPGGLMPRRVPFYLRLVKLRESPQWIIACRLPRFQGFWNVQLRLARLWSNR